MKKKLKYFNLLIHCFVVFFCVFFINVEVLASVASSIAYRTYFGRCPSRSVGALSLRLVQVFDETNSLRSVKQEILQEKLDRKHFISEYQIAYDPQKKFLVLNFDCPEPLMKVQVIKSDGVESYNAVLVDTGELYDSVYELLVRNEKKLTKELPYLALPLGEMDKSVQFEIAGMIKGMDSNVREMLAEVILDDLKQLTVIMSHKGKPSSIFLGNSPWDEKMIKLQKILKYMLEKDKIPSIINLTNIKKVVVKFNDNF